MSPHPVFGETRDERFERDYPDDPPVASQASPGSCVGVPLLWHNEDQYPYTIEASRTLVEDARAVLNGEADYLLANDEQLADVDGLHELDQGNVNAVAPQVTNIPVAPQANIPPQVAVASVVPPVSNQVNHAAITALPQCPHGCPGTFGRPEELRRHMKKHNGPFFPCTHPNCGKMFYRQDKLRDHLAKGH